ncbi:hypothetical protein [Mycobacterium sp.]|uniref:hypothetical protein n=1 Tax=Mycobacterium sp. TaxID=1785 RepID=UPI002CA8F3B9|nr:hypothetical protein [Mycobacterium sp.]HTY35331.1 hypothetical protein [Mycobacterium sp.]
MTINGYRNPLALPHESERERDARERLSHLLATSPILPEYLIDNLALYLRRHQLSDLLSMAELYKMILDVPGVIMEFGVLHGRHLGTLTALRGMYEPYDTTRCIVGFDSFTGFPDVSDVDRVSPSAVAGRFATPTGYPAHLRAVLEAHEGVEPSGHIRRNLVVEGDVRETVPEYLSAHPETVIALAYFDLDVYTPTRVVLDAIRPYLTCGSIVAFDEIGYPRWPGETIAVREVAGLADVALRKLATPRDPPVVYLRWAT